jgi:hypothetical protein
MDKIKAFLLKVFNEDNGEAICVAKILAVMAVFSFIGYAVYGLIHGDHFALDSFGNGLMTVLLGSGGVIAGKNITTKQ